MITEPVVNKKTKKISLKNKYPGNIFIKMIPDSVANFVILSVLKSRGGGQFLGTFLESELNRRLFKFSDNSSIKGSKLKVNFKPDDYVRLILPNFKDKLGKVIRINPYENKVVVAIDLEPTIINVVVRIEDCKRLEE
jgi:transcription antitermination factor NusG